MKKLWALIRNHFAEDFSLPYYLSVTAFLGAAIILNAVFHLEANIDRYMGSFYRVLLYFLLYGVAYYTGIALMIIFLGRRQMLKSVPFWILSVLGLFILAFSAGFPYLNKILTIIEFNQRNYIWVYSVSGNALNGLVVCVPLFIVYRLFPVSRPYGYGLLTPRYDVRPYLLLLLCILPLIAAASFRKEFTDFYPTYKPNSVAEVWNLPKWVPWVTYEFFYGLDFFNVEILFRGFLVIGLSQVLGKNAIMPMVTTYCFLHFGKPVGEQLSSIVGGYLLGIIAFYTRGIWGGVIVHIGVAWSMELAAYLQK